MTKLGSLVLFWLVAMSSCIDIPISLTMQKSIELEENVLNNLEKKIMAELESFDVAHDIADEKIRNACRKGFKDWLKERFQWGFLPADEVLSSEYMGKTPLASVCPSVDISPLYDRAILSARSSIPWSSFSFEEIAGRLKESKCSKAFLDPKKAKIRIDGIDFKVLENSLNTEFPRIELYASPEPLAEGELGQANAKEKLLAKNKIFLIATSEAVPARTIWQKAMMLNSDAQGFRAAQDALIPLKGIVWSPPARFAAKPEKIKIGEAAREFFVIPRGKFAATFTIHLEMSVSLSDAKCALDEFYEEIDKQAP